MRFCMILAVVLAGCTLGGGKLAKPGGNANPITGNAIEVTSLDAPAVVGAADPAKPAPNVVKPAKPDAVQPAPPQPDFATVDLAAAPPVTDVPARVPEPEELACVKKGGQWSVAGKAGGMSCVRRMRDAGKSCHKKSDCEGDCLARSNTCAPIAPLFGCNEILQDNGVMVTLCID